MGRIMVIVSFIEVQGQQELDSLGFILKPGQRNVGIIEIGKLPGLRERIDHPMEIGCLDQGN